MMEPKTKPYDLPSVTERKLAVFGLVLERTAKRMKQYFQQQLLDRGAGVTVDQWVILQQLQRNDGMSQHELAQATFKDAPTVTRILDLLSEKGLLRRTPDEADRRRYRIELTKQGRARIEQVLPIVREFRRQAWTGLSDNDVDRLVESLNQIFDNLNGAT